ncbi:MAG: hypothetical protein AAB582_01335 [Patescibacteria group bacterium]
MKLSVYIAALLLVAGTAEAAENLYDLTNKRSVSLPVTTNVTDRSITVFSRMGFDLETEVPFLLGRSVKSGGEADLYARMRHQEGVTVVENCPMLQVGDNLFRHPETLVERLAGNCIRYGYVEPPKPLIVRGVAAVKKQVRRRR